MMNAEKKTSQYLLISLHCILFKSYTLLSSLYDEITDGKLFRPKMASIGLDEEDGKIFSIKLSVW